jgi:hypothetical protein
MTKPEMGEAHKVNPTTNCVNCGAVINPNVDHCEYCGTSYALMGIKHPIKKSSERKLSNVVGYLHYISGVNVPIDSVIMVSEGVCDVYTNTGIHRREKHYLYGSKDLFGYKYYKYNIFSDKWEKAFDVADIEIF